MFKLYSKGCEYAIRALMYIVPPGGGVRSQAKEVCEQAAIPESFSRKVFQALVQGGFLKAVRGPGGGYVLCNDPEDISLLEIIRAVDGQETFEGCIMGLSVCDAETPCPLHTVWAAAKEELLGQLASKTLGDLRRTAEQRQSEMDAAGTDRS